jgi:putative transposase
MQGQATRQRERQMRRFKSAAHAQRFLSVHGVVQNLFRGGRHLLRAAHHRLLRTRSFRVWDAVTCACWTMMATEPCLNRDALYSLA